MSLLIARCFVSVKWCKTNSATPTPSGSLPTLPSLPTLLLLRSLLDILGPNGDSPCTPSGRTWVT